MLSVINTIFHAQAGLVAEHAFNHSGLATFKQMDHINLLIFNTK